MLYQLSYSRPSHHVENQNRQILKMVGRGGFEPPKAKPSDLQSDPFDRSGTSPDLYLFPLRRFLHAPKMELARGIEPPTR
jgi:hypothetical protein